jgi:hypothetical protein
MKKLYFLASALLFSAVASSQVLMEENFDSYADGDMLSVVGAANGWGEWSGGTGTAESCTVSAAIANSAPNSGNTSGANDGLWTWADISTGIIELNMSVYANAGGGAYLGLGDAGMNDQPHTIHVYSDSMIIFVDWANQVFLGSTGLSGDAWYDLKVVMNIDSSTTEFFINGVSTGTAACGFGGAGVGFGGIDFWGTAYDIFTQATPAGNLNFDDLSVVDITTLSVNELEVVTRAYPNPAVDGLTVSSSMPMSSIAIVDMSGRTISTTSVSGVETTVNVADLNAGVYYYTVTTENGNVVRNSFVKK